MTLRLSGPESDKLENIRISVRKKTDTATIAHLIEDYPRLKELYGSTLDELESLRADLGRLNGIVKQFKAAQTALFEFKPTDVKQERGNSRPKQYGIRNECTNCNSDDIDYTDGEYECNECGNTFI